MSEFPATADELLDAFDQSDRDAGKRSAAVMDGPALIAAAEHLLDVLGHSDQWDLPAKLYLVGPIDALERATGTTVDDKLRAFDPTLPADVVTKMAGQLRDGMLVDEHGNSGVSFALTPYPLGDGHPYDQLAGLELPDWAGAVLLVTEAWMALERVLDDELPATVVRRTNGDAEVRMVTGMTRFGNVVSVMDVRGGPRKTLQRDGGPTPGPSSVRLAGRIPAALARCLGIPATPASYRPWLTLGGAWAEAVVASWPRWLETDTPTEAAVGALRLRPDVALAFSDMLRMWLSDQLHQLDIDPLDDHAVDEAMRSGTIELPDLPDLHAVLGDGPVDEARVVELDALFAKVISESPWDAVRRAALPLSGPLRNVSVKEVATWLDGPSALMHCQFTMTDDEAATELRKVASLPKAPRWFKESARRFRQLAESTELDHPPNPYLTGDDD